MGWIALDDARFDGIGKDATKKSHGARGRSLSTLSPELDHHLCEWATQDENSLVQKSRA